MSSPTLPQLIRAFTLTYLSYAIYCFTRIPYSATKSDINHPKDGWGPFNDPKNGLLYLGALDTVFLLSYSFALFFNASLGEKINIRYLIFLGMLGSGFSVIFFGLGQRWRIHIFPFFLFCNVVSGFFQSTGWPANVTVMSRWFDKRSRGIVMGIWDTHAAFGNILGRVLITYAMEKKGWATAYITAGLVCCVLSVLELLLLIGSPDEVVDEQKLAYPSANYPTYQSKKQPRSKRSKYASSIHSLYDQNLIEHLVSHADSQHEQQHDDLSIQDAEADGRDNDGNDDDLGDDPEGGVGGVVDRDKSPHRPPGKNSASGGPGGGTNNSSNNNSPNSNNNINTPNSNNSNNNNNNNTPGSSAVPHQKKRKIRRKRRAQGRPIEVSALAALTIPGVLLYSICLFFAKFSAYAFIFWLPFYLVTSAAFSPTAANNLCISYDIGGVLGGIVTTQFAEKIGNKRGTAAFICLLLAVPALYFYAHFSANRSPPFQVALLVLLGILVSGPYSLISAAVSSDLATHPLLRGNPGAMGTVTSIIGGTGSLGAATQGLVVGWVASRMGWNGVFAMVMAMLSLSALLLSRVLCKECHIAPSASKQTIRSANTITQDSGTR